MSEMSFEQMLDESFKIIRNGDVVEGKVIDVKPDEIILNIGYKADGVCTKREYTNDPDVDLMEAVKVGDTMDVKVIKVNDGDGQVLLSYKRLAAEKVSEQLKAAFENKEPITATVTQVLKGGLGVMVDGTRVFIPASLVSYTFERDLNKYKDQEITFVLIEYDPRRRRVIGDAKQLIVEERKAKQAELMAKIKIGDVVIGKVKNITDFGAFIDLDGADGLLHISEMSWGRIENPKKVYKVGQELRVFIKDIHDNKIALSARFPDENPWNGADEEFAKGSVVKGKVARMTDFGAFIELRPGVDALLHVSQISKEHIAKPSDVLAVGDEVEAKVVDFDPENHKISLSIKALTRDENKRNSGERKKDEGDEYARSINVEEFIKAQEAKDAAKAAKEEKEAKAEEAAAEVAEESAPAEEAPAAEAPAEAEETPAE